MLYQEIRKINCFPRTLLLWMNWIVSPTISIHFSCLTQSVSKEFQQNAINFEVNRFIVALDIVSCSLSLEIFFRIVFHILKWAFSYKNKIDDKCKNTPISKMYDTNEPNSAKKEQKHFKYLLNSTYMESSHISNISNISKIFDQQSGLNKIEKHSSLISDKLSVLLRRPTIPTNFLSWIFFLKFTKISCNRCSKHILPWMTSEKFVCWTDLNHFYAF